MVQNGSQTFLNASSRVGGREGRADKPLPFKGMTPRLLHSFYAGTCLHLATREAGNMLARRPDKNQVPYSLKEGKT